jgi:hypothetical protein
MRIECPECKITFPVRRDLHVTLKFTDDDHTDTTVCPECGYIAKTKTILTWEDPHE